MTITRRSSLAEVAFVVGDALRRAGVRAVLTGGSCATIHSGGAYTSVDIDFIAPAETTEAEVAGVMTSLGFARERSEWRHPRTDAWVEFPAGPLAIGADYGITPVRLRRGTTEMLGLSPTDSCRDRLAAFYHWNDRQSLTTAVVIACRHRLNWKRIERWSRGEGAADRFAEFKRAVAGARRLR